MIYYASWQHELKTYIHKTTAGNDYRKQILTYTCNHTRSILIVSVINIV